MRATTKRMTRLWRAMDCPGVIVVATWVALVAPGGGRPASAKEPYQQFLDALRERSMCDMALTYIDQMRDSALVASALKQQMPYDEAVTLIQAAQTERDLATRLKHLERAKTLLESFIQTYTSHPLAASAEMERAQVLVVWGRALVEQANRPANAAKKDALLAEGREKLNSAQTVFTAAEEKLTARLRTFDLHIPKSDVKQVEARNQAQEDLQRALLYAAGALHEMAHSYPTGADESKNFLHEAADKYAAIHTRFRKRFSGQSALVKEGQCYQELGDTKRALGLFDLVLRQPDDKGEFRKLKTNTLRQSMRCWNSDAEAKYEIALDRGNKWLKEARPSEERSPDGLAIRYYLAQANKLHAGTLGADDGTRRKRALAEARKQAVFVSNYEGDRRDDAKKLLAELSGLEGAPRAEPASFAEARDRGKEYLEQWQAKLAAKNRAAALRDEANAAVYADEAKQLAEKSYGDFLLALRLREAQTPLDDVNGVRYYLSVLSYAAAKYYDAAVLGEFLAHHYPDGAGGRGGARIAIASYYQAYRSSPPDQGSFEKMRMVALAEAMTRRWPKEAETDEAWGLLMSVALAEGRLDELVTFLGKVALGSPRRGELELRAGQALWAAHLEAARRGDAERPAADVLDERAAKGAELLAQGIDHLRGAVDAGTATVGGTLASAALTLGQIYVEAGKNEQAVALFDDPKVGPLMLVRTKHPAVRQLAKYDVEALALALRADIGAHELDKAEAIVQEFTALAGGDDAQSSEALAKTLGTLSRSLERQTARLRQEGRNDELRDVTQAFSSFLQRIVKGEQGNHLGMLRWVAESFLGLARAYESDDVNVSPEARPYYEQALAAEENLFERLASRDGASADAVLVVKLQMAHIEHRLGRFQGAIATLTDVLLERPMLIGAQREAAATYQDWGRIETTMYDAAIAGANAPAGGGEHLIWGWQKLAARLRYEEKYGDVFHEACYNLAKCLYEQSLVAGDDVEVERADALRRAEREILGLRGESPEMGGPAWREKYDHLLRAIQEALDEPSTGLADENLPLGVNR
jgi:hypothetical protein